MTKQEVETIETFSVHPEIVTGVVIHREIWGGRVAPRRAAVVVTPTGEKRLGVVVEKS